MVLPPYSPKDPNIVMYLSRHCHEGWSAYSFAGLLKAPRASGKNTVLKWLIRSNKEFREAFAFFSLKQNLCHDYGPIDCYIVAETHRQGKLVRDLRVEQDS